MVNQKNKVIVCITEDFKAQIEKVGAEFRPPPISIEKLDFRLAKDPLNIAQMSLDMSKRVTPLLEKIIKKEKPDCIIHDSLSLWGKIVAKSTRTPAVSLIPSMAISLPMLLSCFKTVYPELISLFCRPEKTLNILRLYRDLYHDFGVKPPFITDVFCNEGDLNIVFTSKYLQILGDSFSNKYKFIGPVIYHRNEKINLPLLNTKKKIIYISLGTVYNDKPFFYKNCIDAFKDTPYQIFMSLGKHIKIADLGEIPTNFYIKTYLPQIQILPKASLFISHGGMNSINESLYFGIPLLVFPQMQEQRINASRVEELGAGIYFKKNETDKETLVNLIEQILKNRSYQQNAEKIRASFVNAGGYKRAVEEILRLVN